MKRFSHFWKSRNKPGLTIVDQTVAYNISIFIAYASHRVGLTPNHLSVGSGIFAIGAFVSAISLPADQVSLAVSTIFAFSVLSHLFDCADGQLARATDTASKFGECLDVGMDIASSLFYFGGFFGYLYRHYSANGDLQLANSALLIGFLFLLARSSRFFAGAFFRKNFTNYRGQSRDGLAITVLKNLSDTVVLLSGMLLFFVSPILMFGLFCVLAVVHTGAYVRFFFRAYRLDIGDKNNAG